MNFRHLFKKKALSSIDPAEKVGEHSLKRSLGALQLTSIGLGAIIGAGIFVIVGPTAALYAGPGIALSYIIAAIVCLVAGLCFAELSSMIPVSGGAYSYAYVAMGEFPAWIVAWALIAQYIFSLSVVAVGWSGYCSSFLHDFGISIPASLSSSPISYHVDTGWKLTQSFINLPSVIILGIVGTLVSIGVKAATHFNNIMVVIKMSTIALFIILGIAFIKPSNWLPFVPENTGIFGEFGWSGIIRAAGLLLFAYIGFDSVSTLAQEAIKPQRDIPRGILGSLFISTIAYILISLVLTGIVRYTSLNIPDPMAVALTTMGSSFLWLKGVIQFAILAALTSVVLVQLMAITRILLSVSSDGLIPKNFGKIHRKTRTPLFACIVGSLVCMVLSGLFPVDVLLAIVSMNFLLILAIVCLGVLLLRHFHPATKRPFKVPFVPFVPALGIVFCLGQMAFLPLSTWMQFLLWTGLGIVVYFSYGIHRSKLRKNS